MSRSDYDDMPSNGGGRRGKGNKGLTLGVLICILVVLIIIVVRLIFKPEEKLEVLPPNSIVKESTADNVVAVPSLDDIPLDSSSSETTIEEPVSSETEETIYSEDLETVGEVDLAIDNDSPSTESTGEVSGEPTQIIENASGEYIPEEIENVEENSQLEMMIEVEEETVVKPVEDAEIIEVDDPINEENRIENIIESESVSPDSIETKTEEIILEEPNTVIQADNEEIEGEVIESEEIESEVTESEEIESEEIESDEIEIEVVESEVVETTEEVKEIEEKPLPYDPFMSEDVETLRNSLGELLSRINFNLILSQDEEPIEEESRSEEVVSLTEVETESQDTLPSMPSLINETEEVVIDNPPAEIITEDSMSIEETDESSSNEPLTESVDEEKPILENEEVTIVEIITDEAEPSVNYDEIITEDDSSSIILPQEESKEVSKTQRIEEKSSEIIPGSFVVVDGESVTLLSTPGNAVKSPIPGVVVEAKRVEGKKSITIETEEGEVWRFSGFERVNVKLNQNIKEGDILGSVGTSTGSEVNITLINL